MPQRRSRRSRNARRAVLVAGSGWLTVTEPVTGGPRCSADKDPKGTLWWYRLIVVTRPEIEIADSAESRIANVPDSFTLSP